MRYKVLGVVMTGVMMLSMAGLSYYGPDGTQRRYHQHRDAPVPEKSCTCDGSELCTHLPIVRIETGGQVIPGEVIRDENEEVIGYTTTQSGESEIVVRIETVEAEGEWHHASDPADQSAVALFRIRGNSSRNFDKKNYRVKLVADEMAVENLPLPLLGMNPDNDWALHGPFLDKTLLRNYMWMNLSAEVMGYAPNVRFCEVILDGEYQGVYVLMETIKEDEYRVDLSDYDPDMKATSYLLRLDAAERLNFITEEDDVVLFNYTWYTHQTEFSETARSGFQILYPRTEDLTQEAIDYIKRDISRMERGLYSADMLLGKYDYASELDMDSFVDYYILQEFLAVNDAFSRSTYFYRDVRGKLHIGPVWDYNNVLDNFLRPFSYHGFLLATRGWYGRLMMDEDFVNQVIDRYRQLRQGILSSENLLQYIEETIAYLGPAIARNDVVWGYSYDPYQLSPHERRAPDEGQTLAEVNPSSYEGAVLWMEEYIQARGEWMDAHIEELLQYCHPSKTAAQRVE